MTEQEKQTLNEKPIIPPLYLLLGAMLAALVGVGTLLITPSSGVVIYGAFGVAVLLLLLVILLNPRATADFFMGRAFKFGGVSLIFTLFTLAFLIVLYTYIRSLNITLDLTEASQFTLNPEARDMVTRVGVDPTFPEIELIGFFDGTQTSQREQTELLLRDYSEASGGKIRYELVNPDLNPRLAETFSVMGGVVLVKRADDDTPENAEQVFTGQGFDQNQLTNSILAVGASGDFRAYFLTVDDGLSIDDTGGAGMSDLRDFMGTVLRWDVRQLSTVELLSPNSEIDLNDSAADGVVLGIAGGSQPLSETERDVIIEYLDNGGSLVLFASPNLEGDELASEPVLSEYLLENYGIAFNDDVIFDPSQAFQFADFPVVTDLRPLNTITGNVAPNSALILQYARSIQVAETPPSDVVVNQLAFTTPAAYTKTPSEWLQEQIEQTDTDPTGPFLVLASAQNTETGGRVVLVSSVGIAANQFTAAQGVANVQVAANAFLWATNYEEFARTIPQVAPLDLRAQDTPFIVGGTQLNIITFVNLLGLPFGVLLVGLGVWALRRR